tara:strand:+ start:428 stop:568 length:141 start_codon:yes stop_codon:yes gene_type:complete
VVAVVVPQLLETEDMSIQMVKVVTERFIPLPMVPMQSMVLVVAVEE